MLFDTHAHLDQEDFDNDRDEVIARAHDAGVSEIVTIGTSASTSAICVELATRYDGLYAAVGIQPQLHSERLRLSQRLGLLIRLAPQHAPAHDSAFSST